uniref:Uncharacterized protein n=1 Tax=Rhizophora mucronata TaxID=61149 RepID=A0A2P2Q6M1_RHIMU
MGLEGSNQPREHQVKKVFGFSYQKL